MYVCIIDIYIYIYIYIEREREKRLNICWCSGDFTPMSAKSSGSSASGDGRQTLHRVV